MIVVDTNVITPAIFKCEFTSAVLALHEHDPEWQAPVYWKSEFIDVVSIFLRKKIISFAEALEAVDIALSFIGNREHVTSPYALLEWLDKSTCSSYDCELVALADKLGTKLVTYDKQLLRWFPAIAIKPEDFLAQIR